MAKKYEKIRDWVKENPGVPPQMREYFTKLDDLVSWPTTTTTTSTTTTTTTTTT